MEGFVIFDFYAAKQLMFQGRRVRRSGWPDGDFAVSISPYQWNISHPQVVAGTVKLSLLLKKDREGIGQWNPTARDLDAGDYTLLPDV